MSNVIIFLIRLVNKTKTLKLWACCSTPWHTDLGVRPHLKEVNPVSTQKNQEENLTTAMLTLGDQYTNFLFIHSTGRIWFPRETVGELRTSAVPYAVILPTEAKTRSIALCFDTVSISHDVMCSINKTCLRRDGACPSHASPALGKC